MIERLDAFFSESSVAVHAEEFSRAKERVVKLFQDHYGTDNEIVSINDSISSLPTNTSAGMPFKPGTTKFTARNQIKKLCSMSWKRVSSKQRILVTPCIAGCRRALRERGTNKPRLVWAYPAYLNVIESQFTYPFMERKPPFIGWYYNWFDYGLSIDNLMCNVAHGRSWMNLDFSSFDSTVPAFLIREAFDVMRSCLNLSDTEQSMFNQLIDYFIHTPIVMYSKCFQKYRGIPSGSAFTQIIGSIVNMLACLYSEESHAMVTLLEQKSVWLGDDSCLVFESDIGRTDMLHEWTRSFSDLGLVVNESKTLYSPVRHGEPFKFLGHCSQINVRKWIVDTETLMSQATIPEFNDKYPEDAIQRLAGLCWTYGCDEDAYSLLSDMYFHVVNTFKRTLSSTYESKSMMRFLVLNGLTWDDVKTFPKYQTIRDRQYGENTFNIKRKYYF